MKRWLYLVHRWVGIALCIVMALWFVSGVVMMYVGYPKLTPSERLAGLPPLPLQGCCVPLPAALDAAGFGNQADSRASTWRLTTVAGELRYVFADSRRQVAVDARTGRRVTSVAADDAVTAARHFAGGVPGRHVGEVQEDAWTHSRALDLHRPLHVVDVDDPASNRLYVSSRTSEVVRDASLTERTWGWLGAWMHWLYIFRGGMVDAWWTDIIIALSVAGTVAALTGMVVGVWRWRFSGRFRTGRRTPYANPMARWHHILGLIGGALCFTWVLSGLLSVNPWKVFTAPGAKPDRLMYAGGHLQPDLAPSAAQVLAIVHAQGVAPHELQWRRVGGVHDVLATSASAAWVIDTERLHSDGMPVARWRKAADALLPGARVVREERLTTYDRWYYTREPHTMTGHGERPLPAWRLQFDDANETWVTIDERTGSIVQVSDSHRRVDRWLFAFLHSFDLPQLLSARPAWDVWMVFFSAVGLGLSLTGVVTGWRRLRRKASALGSRTDCSPRPSSGTVGP